MPARRIHDALEAHYRLYNRRRFVHPDPLELLYAYDDPADREIAGLVASSLAYGRVAQILRSASNVLERLGPAPARFVRDATDARLGRTLAGFRHRFSTAEEMTAMLAGARRAIRRYGSLGACLVRGLGRGDETIAAALGPFVAELIGPGAASSLLPDPAKGSACKRLNLLMRWMVRRDEVDTGTWPAVPARLLIVPLDTHMHKIARALGLTRRRAANLRTAIEITAGFRSICPEDPVRYDFSLTRLGIHPEVKPCEFLTRW